jgi:hypothetical protein
MKLSLLLPTILALTTSTIAVAIEKREVQSSIYVEPKTSISFSAYQDATSGYTFGVALPETPTTDFIGLLVGKGTGWSGASLGGPMVNKLLIAAWPSGTKIMGTFRKTAYVPPLSPLNLPFPCTTVGLVQRRMNLTKVSCRKYGPPPEVTGTFKQTPIAAGTYTNATHWSYVFVCAGCIATDGTTFNNTATAGTFGWAVNAAAPATPASTSTSLSKHTAQGTYTLDLGAAKSANYTAWAALATKPSDYYVM